MAEEVPPTDPAGFSRSAMARAFGTPAFFRLWLAQISSSTGDWLWFLAVAFTAQRVGSGVGEGAAVGFALLARIAPAFFLAPIVGALVDRFDRKRTMWMCDLGRAAVVLLLPAVDTVWQLVAVSLALELFTLFWAPAKEASVPHLVPREHLTSVNSLSMIAAYGTILPASLLYTGLGWTSRQLADVSFLDPFDIDQESLAYFLDAITFVISAVVVLSLPIPRVTARAKQRRAEVKGIDIATMLAEVREGWQFTFREPVVRAVNVGLATALLGGAMLVPLGLRFATDVLNEDADGHGTLMTMFGLGTSLGVLLLTITQRRLDKARAFAAGLLGGAVFLFLAASTTTLFTAAFAVAGVGICAGAIYVLGFTLLHERVDDDLRGRAFGALYTLVRLAVLIAFAAGPFLTEAFNGLTEQLFDQQRVEIAGIEIFVPGVRVTLWVAALIIGGAAGLAMLSLRGTPSERRAVP